MPRFVSRPIAPEGEAIARAGANEPPLPAAFRWDDRVLDVAEVVRAWRSTKDDRGDTYLKRHWFEFVTAQGARAVVYYDREARRGAPHWWLFTIDEA
jgi:hypothetical protein